MTIFEKIIAREIPGHIIYEDERVIAFLTIQPLAEGHTLVVPKKAVDQLWDMEAADYDYLMTIVKKVGLHLRQALGAERVGAVVKGFDVPHVHVHLVPMLARGQALDSSELPPIVEDGTLAATANTLSML